jgi:hypothetical protein
LVHQGVKYCPAFNHQFLRLSIAHSTILLLIPNSHHTNLNNNALLSFLRSQLLINLPTPTASFTGKTVIVTGSNIGLGKEAARHFARLGASTTNLAVRDVPKGDAAESRHRELDLLRRRRGAHMAARHE